MEINTGSLKRKRIDVHACPAPEDASSFYKRLGLDILAAPSGQSEETKQPRKRFSPNTKPTQVHDKVVPKWTEHYVPNIKPTQVHNNVVPKRTEQPRQRYVPYTKPAQVHDKVVPKWTEHYVPNIKPTQVHNNVVPKWTEQPRQRYVPYTKPAQVQDRVVPKWSQPQLTVRQCQRVVKKEPQVKPINKYAPPDYVTIKYHPTPTLEDLGLTSYLDSPPSSPRAVSPDRDSAHVPDTTVISEQGVKKSISGAPQSTGMTERPQVSGAPQSTGMTERPQAIYDGETVFVPIIAPRGWAPLIKVDVPSTGNIHSVTSMHGGHTTSALTSQPAHSSTKPSSTMAKRPRIEACGWVSSIETTPPYRCWSQ